MLSNWRKKTNLCEQSHEKPARMKKLDFLEMCPNFCTFSFLPINRISRKSILRDIKIFCVPREERQFHAVRVSKINHKKKDQLKYLLTFTTFYRCNFGEHQPQLPRKTSLMSTKRYKFCDVIVGP